MTNAQIARAFEKIANILSLKNENPFRIRAYQRAAQTIQALSEDLEMIYTRKGKEALLSIPGIGEDLAAKIEELVKTGRLKFLSDLEKKVPAGLIEITEIQGMGPKKTKFVWEKFKVKTMADLEKLAKSGKLNKVKGWGDKSVENILAGISAFRTHSERVSLPTALALAEQIVAQMKASKLCGMIDIAGSVRRRKETIGDIDILVTAKDVEKTMDYFCTLDGVERVLAKGETRASVQLAAGVNCDLRVIDADAFGAALHYFTGSKEHNIHVRQMGIKKGYTINEYGVHMGTAEKKGKLLASKTEEDVYKIVGLPYIEPELREDRGEIDRALEGNLPTLLELKDLKGDLHMHSTFSDGSAEVVDMARAAKEYGHDYIAICDHASPMGMVRGIKEENIEEYLGIIERARKDVKGIEIMAGAEVDIMEDGSLYLSDKSLAKLDWVVASIHSHFKLTREAMTARLLRAIENPYVCMIAHPTSRLLLRRDPIDYDFDAVFAAAAKHNVAMEINASIFRLDLNDVLARRAKEAGVMITINSDAHHPREFDYRFGVFQARRGWLEKKDVINTMSFAELKKQFSLR